MKLNLLIFSKFVTKNNLKEKLILISAKYFSNNILYCDEHNLLQIFLNSFYDFYFQLYKKC